MGIDKVEFNQKGTTVSSDDRRVGSCTRLTHIPKGLGTMEALHSFVAISSIYLPDAIATLQCSMDAQTLEEACNRAQEAHAVLKTLLKLSEEAALELKTLHRPTSQTQEAEAVLRCLLLTSESAQPELKKA